MIYSALFERHPDWLTCTLANASNVLPDSAHTLPDGTRITRKANGILWLEPPAGRANSNTEALIVSAGVHGNETAPIEVLNGLVSELLEGKWSLACPLLLILGNPPAMVAG
ncbi:MAG: succinylglutamate desuccinylase, partial [Marinobacter sp. 34-60-7]